MNLKSFLMNGRGWIGAALVAVALATIALAGGAGIGQAASSPSITPTLTFLSTNPLVQYLPSPGGNIGYDLEVTNNGTSIANHLSLTETIGNLTARGGGTLAYVNATVSKNGAPIVCNGINPTTSTLTCTISKLDVGASISVITLFRTNPAAQPGDAVTLTGGLAFDSQTNGTANQKTVPLHDPPLATSIAGAPDGSVAQSIFLPGEQLPAGGAGQSSNIQMPGAGFLNHNDYVGASLQNIGNVAPLCLHCPALATLIDVPLAHDLTNPLLQPFYDGASTNPFTWTLTLNQLPNGYKFTGVYHNGDLIPPCSISSTAPDASFPICVSTVVITKTTITVTGKALENGSYQFG